MNNQIAAECCGSCGWYCWNGRLLKYTCHNPEIVKQHKQNTFKPESLCVPNYYSPRNPIPIIDIPGVKKLVEKAFRNGMRWDPEDFSDDRLDYDTFENNSAKEYLKGIEDKDE